MSFVRRAASIVLALLPIFAATAATPPSVAQELSPAEARGRTIYERGLLAEDADPAAAEIVAVLGGAPIPAAALPCAGCHGADGRGLAEGGVVPPDLVWSELSRPDGARLPSGRERPPYTDALLRRAITMGIDSGATDLHRAMPRYQMPRAALDDLLAYLHRLGDLPEPGVTENKLRLGTLLPDGPTGDAVVALLEARFARLNAEGGVYGRPVELEIRRGATDTASQAMALRDLLRGDDLFALVAPSLIGLEDVAADLAREHRIPIVGPFAVDPAAATLDHPLPSRWIFHLNGGRPDQALALTRRAAATHEAALLVHPDGADTDPAILAALDEAARLDWKLTPLTAKDDESPAELAARLLASRPEALLYLGDGAQGDALLAALADGAHNQNAEPPTLYAPGDALARWAAQADPVWADHLVLAFASVPEDITPIAFESDRRLAVDRDLPRHDLSNQLAALTAAELLLEGIERCGRDPRRDAFVEALEGLYDHPTGLTPPLTFTPNRRIGSRGVWMVKIDPTAKRLAADGWVELR